MRTMTARVVAAAAAATACAAVMASVDLAAQRDRYERIRCESRQDRDEFCSAPIAGDVRVARQLSDTDCRQGRNWSWDSRGIYVRDGCRAEFEYRRRGDGGGWGGSGGSGGRDRVTCQSQKDREQFCPAPIAGNVRVARQLSDAPCVQGRTWNWNRNGVRVWEGCRAEFEYRPRGGELDPGSGNLRRVTCQSQEDRERFCPAPIAGEVRVVRQISDTRCRQGRNWNWTRDGVRVWQGCRAEFEYRARQ